MTDKNQDRESSRSEKLMLGVYDSSHRKGGSYWQWPDHQLDNEWDQAIERIQSDAIDEKTEQIKTGWFPNEKVGAPEKARKDLCFWLYRVYPAGRDGYGRPGREFIVLFKLNLAEDLLLHKISGVLAFFEKERSLPLNTNVLDGDLPTGTLGEELLGFLEDMKKVEQNYENRTQSPRTPVPEEIPEESPFKSTLPPPDVDEEGTGEAADALAPVPASIEGEAQQKHVDHPKQNQIKKRIKKGKKRTRLRLLIPIFVVLPIVASFVFFLKKQNLEELKETTQLKYKQKEVTIELVDGNDSSESQGILFMQDENKGLMCLQCKGRLPTDVNSSSNKINLSISVNIGGSNKIKIHSIRHTSKYETDLLILIPNEIKPDLGPMSTKEVVFKIKWIEQQPETKLELKQEIKLPQTNRKTN